MQDTVVSLSALTSLIVSKAFPFSFFSPIVMQSSLGVL